MATDDTSFYWATRTSLRSVAKSGAPVGVDTSVALVAAAAAPRTWLAVDATSVYWNDSLNSLSSIPKTGGTLPKTLASPGPSVVALDATDVYFGMGTSVSRVPVGGGSITKVADGVECAALVLDATYVYCRTATNLVRFPKSGGAPTSLLQAASGDNLLLLISDKLYVNRYYGGKTDLVTVPAAGGLVEVVDLGGVSFTEAQIGAYGGALYLSQSIGDELRIRRLPVDGSASSAVTVPTFGNSTRLVIDASGVYWMDSRLTCLLTRTYPSQGKADAGSIACLNGLDEILILRLPLVL